MVDVYKQSEPTETDLLFAKEYDPGAPGADYVELAHCVAGYREQCERAAARKATLAVVERIRGWDTTPDIDKELDRIEREAKEGT